VRFGHLRSFKVIGIYTNLRFFTVLPTTISFEAIARGLSLLPWLQYTKVGLKKLEFAATRW